MTAEPTIFVVDDDAAVRRALTAAGQLLGRAVRAFASAAEFLAAYVPSMPGCLVLDIRMPGMSGLELSDMAAGRHAELKIILISGYFRPQAINRRFLQKPFRTYELDEAIRAEMTA